MNELRKEELQKQIESTKHQIRACRGCFNRTRLNTKLRRLQYELNTL